MVPGSVCGLKRFGGGHWHNKHGRDAHDNTCFHMSHKLSPGKTTILFVCTRGCVKTQLSELWGTGRVPGFRVSECRTYGRRGQRCGLNLCVSPSLPELECLCILEGQSNDKGLE